MSEPESTTPQETSTPEPQGDEKVRPSQQRINQLTRKYREAERGLVDADAVNADLQQKLVDLSGQVEVLRKGTAREEKSSNPLDPFAGTLSQPNPAQSPGDLGEVVREAVSQVMDQQRAQENQGSTLRVAQKQSFAEAAKDLPAILRDGSEAQLLFDELWSGNPEIHGLDRAPAMIISMVKGSLGARSDSDTEQRKIAASSPSPTPTQRLDNISSDRGQVETRLAELVEKQKTAGWTDAEWQEYLRVKLTLASKQD